MRRARVGSSIALAVLFLMTPGALAKKNNPVIELRFIPQQTISGVSVEFEGSILDRPASFVLRDGRAGNEPDVIGFRTDDDDRRFYLLSPDDVLSFVDGVARDVASEWGVRIQDDADLTLEGELLKFHLGETNQAVGATYKAEVRIAFRLKDMAGSTLWSGSMVGDATRYGKKFSSDNSNEVLSDALLECLADALENTGLQRAWSGQEPAEGPATATASTSTADASVAPPIAPDALLAEVNELRESGLETETIVDYVEGKTLAAALSADDLVRWKNAGVPQEVIRAALSRPVQGG